MKRFFLGLLTILLVLVLGAGGLAYKVYLDAKTSVRDTYKPVERQQARQMDLSSGKPFSLLLMGIDTGEEGRTDVGRSDSMIVAVVNPQTKRTTFVSIPRDTYTQIIGHGTRDKINHAYAFGGAKMSLETVENLLQIPLDHYVSIDMQGLHQLVDAVGGVDVDNAFAFSLEGHHFNPGKIHLNGEEALAYSRMRYEDPNGDYGRQARQRQLITGIIKEAVSINSLTSYKSILSAVESNMLTDLQWGDMVSLTKYTSAFDQVSEDVLHGEGVMIDGVSYQQVSPEELHRVQKLLQKELGTALK